MKKIEKLTPEQIAKFPEYIKKWIKIGLSTEPANKEKTEKAIEEMYKIAGLQKPKIIWYDSPLSQGMTRAIILEKQLLKNSKDSVGKSVLDSVGESVWSSIGESGYGQHDANWLAFYDFFRNECDLDLQTIKLQELFKQAQNTGWYLPHEKICWVSERHHILERDDRGRLHNLTGAALMYPDGWAIYAINGVRVPKWIVKNPEEITVEKIFAETNAEIRRVMCERFGFRRFGQSLIDSGKAKLISEQSVWDEPVRYYHYNDGAVTMGFVHVINGTTEQDGTKHEFILTVKADNDNAEQAVLSTYPQLMERIKDWPNKWDILKKSIRT